MWAMAAIGWAALLTYLLVMPPVEGDNLVPFPHRDKIAHFGLFGVWTWILLLADSSRLDSPRFQFIALIGCGYGILTELMQRYVPGRSCDIWDVIADATGVVLAVYVFKFWRSL